VSRNAFISLRSEKNIFFDVDIVVKNKSKCGLAWSVPLSTMSMHNYSFPKHFFSYCAVPENIYTPPTEGIGISWGEGFSKPKKFKEMYQV